MLSLPIDLSSLLADSGSVIHLQDTAAIETLSLGEMHATLVAPAVFDLTVANADTGIAIFGTVSATARLECARCVEPFELELSAQVEAVATTEGDRSVFDEDEEWYPLIAETLDLVGPLTSALLAEIPFAPVHDEACKGICPACGCDLNSEECDCAAETQSVDGPFAALRDHINGSGDD